MSDTRAPDRRRAVEDSLSHEHRRTRVLRLLEREGLDAVVAVGPDYATWLGGYHRYAAGTSATVVGAAGQFDLMVSVEEGALAEEGSDATRIYTFGDPGFGMVLDVMPWLADALSRLELVHRSTRIGIAGLTLSVLLGSVVTKAVPVDAQLGSLMTVKDRDEVEKIARSYGLCLEAQAAVARGVSEGASEVELFTSAHASAQLAAGEPVEFLADLLAGTASAKVSGPVAVAGHRRPAAGEPVLADILVRAAGYWADTCRTHVRGDNDELEVLHVELRSVLDASVDELRPGVRASTIFRTMESRIHDLFPDSVSLPHHGGHGLGLEPVASPNLSPRDDTMLEAGMVLAVEPGVYFPGRFGMRLENEYLVTPDGGIELHAALATLSEGADS